MKNFKYLSAIVGMLLMVPAFSFADYQTTLQILANIRAVEVSAGGLLSNSPDLRSAIEQAYQGVLDLLRTDLNAIQTKTVSVIFQTISSPLVKGTLATIKFDRLPANSSSPINVSMGTASGKFVGALANNVIGNNVDWQVADQFFVGKNYQVLARSLDGKLLGQSDLFTVSSSTSNVPSPVVSAMTPAISVSVPPVVVNPPPVSNPSPSVLPTPSAADIASADINNGSIGYWSFDKYSNTCDTKGGANTNADGKFGSALGLNGIDGYCVVTNNRNLYPKNFTLALWAKSDPTYISGWNDSSWFISLRDQSGFNIGPVKGKKDVRFTILDDTNLDQVPYLVGTVTPDDITAWHHYAMTYDGTMARIYLDGALVSSTTTTISRSYAGNKNIYFGLDDAVGQPHGAGTLDEIRMYNRPLTACEIQLLAGRGCGNLSHQDSMDNNIAAVYTAF